LSSELAFKWIQNFYDFFLIIKLRGRDRLVLHYMSW